MAAADIARDFPRLAQDATPALIEASVQYLAGLPLAELRDRQATHRGQIKLAIEQGKDDVAASEQIKLDMTTDAVSRVAFGTPMPGLHSDITPTERQA